LNLARSYRSIVNAARKRVNPRVPTRPLFQYTRGPDTLIHSCGPDKSGDYKQSWTSADATRWCEMAEPNRCKITNFLLQSPDYLWIYTKKEKNLGPYDADPADSRPA